MMKKVYSQSVKLPGPKAGGKGNGKAPKSGSVRNVRSS